jgi:hypothetical protein
MAKTTGLTKLGTWTVECDEKPRRFERKEDVSAYISELVRKQSSGRIDVDEDVGARSWLARTLLGLHPRILQMHLALEWSDGAAALIFFDDAVSEYRAMDSEQPLRVSEATRKRIGHGELDGPPAEQCLGLDRALQAIDEYLKSGNRPAWLRYEYVK